jgi:hypothetical protein
MLFDHARSGRKDRSHVDNESIAWDPYLVKAVRQCQPAALSENTAIAMDDLGATSGRRPAGVPSGR